MLDAAAVAEPADPASPPRLLAVLLRKRGRRESEIAILTVCQFLYYMGVSVDLTLTAIVGLVLAPNAELATVPSSVMAVVTVTGSFAAGLLSARYGHRNVLLSGAAFAVLGGCVSALAIERHSFLMLCAGTALVGVYKATGGYIRYLAADRALPEHRERALSIVLCGGVLAAIVGPLAATGFSHLLSAVYAGSYVLVAILAAVVIPLIAMIRRRPVGRAAAPGQPARPAAVTPARVALTSPGFRGGFAALTVGGTVMTLLMTTGPLGSMAAGNGMADTSFMIQWHMMGMFVPSFFSGRLCTRFGARRTGFAGSAILCAGAAIGACSMSMAAMTMSLLLVGVGWNFLFVSGTALVVRSYPQGTGGRIQALADGGSGIFLAAASLASGFIFNSLGWTTVSALSTIPPLLLCLGLVAFAVVRRNSTK